MTSQSGPAAIILAGDDGRVYRFPADAMARWRQPAGAAATGTDDPTYTSPDGACYVIPRAEVEGYCLSEEENAAIRSQLEQSAGAEVTGYTNPQSGCPPGYTQYYSGGVYTCVSPAPYAWYTGTSTTPNCSSIPTVGVRIFH